MRILLLATAFAALLGLTAPRTAAADAKMFVEKGCNKCHSISAQKIEKKGGDEEEGDTKVPDLSTIGKDQNAAFFKAYITKEAEHDGKKHKIKFKGTDEELTTMANWLASLK